MTNGVGDLGTLLITGGAGYIGSHFAALLDDHGVPYVVVDNLSRGNASLIDRKRLEVGDVGDRAFITDICRRYGVDCAVHFAAFAYVGESGVDPRRYYENNVRNGIAFLDGLRDAGVGRLVFSSSCATYGEPPNGWAIDESTEQRPVNPYGRTKLIFEQILSDYDRAYGFRSICLRYFNAAGCSERKKLFELHDPETHLIPLAVEAAVRETPLFIFGDDYGTEDGTCVRDYVHVDDLATAHLASAMLLRGGAASNCVNLGLGRGTSVAEVIDAVEAVVGKPVRRRVVARRPGDPAVLVADVAKARAILDWNPTYRGINDIVRTAFLGFQRARALQPG